jgi:hypothetical protein
VDAGFPKRSCSNKEIERDAGSTSRDSRAILATSGKEKLFEGLAGRLLIAWRRLSGYL